jgi:hypothetical protein
LHDLLLHLAQKLCRVYNAYSQVDSLGPH